MTVPHSAFAFYFLSCKSVLWDALGVTPTGDRWSQPQQLRWQRRAWTCSAACSCEAWDTRLRWAPCLSLPPTPSCSNLVGGWGPVCRLVPAHPLSDSGYVRCRQLHPGALCLSLDLGPRWREVYVQPWPALPETNLQASQSGSTWQPPTSPKGKICQQER